LAINLRLVFIVLVSLASLQLAGCASITGGTQQSISVETRSDVTTVAGAACEITNAKGKWFVSTPGSAQIQRSNDPLLITCNKQGYDQGRASVESVTRAGMAGNFIFGGLIGAAIDHSSGAAYDYPNLIQVMMGQSNLISYSYEQGTAPGTVNSKPVQAGGSATNASSQTTVSSQANVSNTPQPNTTPVVRNLVLNTDGSMSPANTAASSAETPKSDMVRTEAYRAESTKLEVANKRCVELGFLPQTESFGQCMLRVSK
jgi:hypothetical protein